MPRPPLHLIADYLNIDLVRKVLDINWPLSFTPCISTFWSPPQANFFAVFFMQNLECFPCYSTFWVRTQISVDGHQHRGQGRGIQLLVMFSFLLYDVLYCFEYGRTALYLTTDKSAMFVFLDWSSLCNNIGIIHDCPVVQILLGNPWSPFRNADHRTLRADQATSADKPWIYVVPPLRIDKWKWHELSHYN